MDDWKVDVVIIDKLDRLTRSVKDLAELLEPFQKRGVSLAVSLFEREAIGERNQGAMSIKK